MITGIVDAFEIPVILAGASSPTSERDLMRDIAARALIGFNERRGFRSLARAVAYCGCKLAFKIETDRGGQEWCDPCGRRIDGAIALSYLSAMPWDTPLTRPIEIRNGRVLTTLADARDYILGSLNERAQILPYWDYAARLLLAAGADGATAEDVAEAWAQMRRALLNDGMISVG